MRLLISSGEDQLWGVLVTEYMGQIEAASRITNCREANQHLTREYRKGWDLKDIAG